MIKADGFKAFKGTMRISPIGAEPFDLRGDWIYKPNGYWCHGFQSWPEKICEVVDDETLPDELRVCPCAMDGAVLRERLAKVCKERDELKKKLEGLTDGQDI